MPISFSSSAIDPPLGLERRHVEPVVEDRRDCAHRAGRVLDHHVRALGQRLVAHPRDTGVEMVRRLPAAARRRRSRHRDRRRARPRAGRGRPGGCPRPRRSGCASPTAARRSPARRRHAGGDVAGVPATAAAAGRRLDDDLHGQAQVRRRTASGSAASRGAGAASARVYHGVCGDGSTTLPPSSAHSGIA